jgi:hypothetical protein
MVLLVVELRRFHGQWSLWPMALLSWEIELSMALEKVCFSRVLHHLMQTAQSCLMATLCLVALWGAQLSLLTARVSPFPAAGT